jgi:hypothetical protein
MLIGTPRGRYNKPAVAPGVGWMKFHWLNRVEAVASSARLHVEISR